MPWNSLSIRRRIYISVSQFKISWRPIVGAVNINCTKCKEYVVSFGLRSLEYAFLRMENRFLFSIVIDFWIAWFVEGRLESNLVYTLYIYLHLHVDLNVYVFFVLNLIIHSGRSLLNESKLNSSIFFMWLMWMPILTTLDSHKMVQQWV